jgi:hypothetical protein
MWKCICIVYDEQLLLLPLLNNCCYLCGFNVTKCSCALCVVRSFKCNTLTLKVKIYNFKQLKLQQKFWPNLWHGNLMHFGATTLMWTWIANVHYIGGIVVRIHIVIQHTSLTYHTDIQHKHITWTRAYTNTCVPQLKMSREIFIIIKLMMQTHIVKPRPLHSENPGRC